jgi:hypothetical protein
LLRQDVRPQVPRSSGNWILVHLLHDFDLHEGQGKALRHAHFARQPIDRLSVATGQTSATISAGHDWRAPARVFAARSLHPQTAEDVALAGRELPRCADVHEGRLAGSDSGIYRRKVYGFKCGLEVCPRHSRVRTVKRSFGFISIWPARQARCPSTTTWCVPTSGDSIARVAVNVLDQWHGFNIFSRAASHQAADHEEFERSKANNQKGEDQHRLTTHLRHLSSTVREYKQSMEAHQTRKKSIAIQETVTNILIWNMKRAMRHLR